jgi:hypothetical protein
MTKYAHQNVFGHTVLIQPSLQSHVTQAHEVKRFFKLSHITTGFEENFGENLMVTLKKSACGTKFWLKISSVMHFTQFWRDEEMAKIGHAQKGLKS